MGSRLTVATSWRALAASVAGSSHVARAEPCQDAVLVRDLDDGRLVIAVADGAGSAPLAHEGSSEAVEAATEAIVSGADIACAFERAAATLGEEPSLRATTLLVAVLGEDALEVGQVGDGFIVIQRENAYEVAVPAPEREFLNETTFLSSTDWRDDLRLASHAADAVHGVAVMTDGIQLVAFDLATNEPFPGFFDPVFAWAQTNEANDDELAAFLSSPRLASRTDDDITLAIARRR